MQHTCSYLIAIMIDHNLQQVLCLVKTSLLQHDVAFPKIAF